MNKRAFIILAYITSFWLIACSKSSVAPAPNILGKWRLDSARVQTHTNGKLTLDTLVNYSSRTTYLELDAGGTGTDYQPTANLSLTYTQVGTQLLIHMQDRQPETFRVQTSTANILHLYQSELVTGSVMTKNYFSSK